MAGGKSKTFKNSILLLEFNNVPIADIGDPAGILGSSVPGNYYIRLFNTDLVNAASLGTEASYAGYVAGGIAIPRTAGGFTVTNEVVTNAGQFQFAKCVSGSETLRYFGIFKDNNTNVESERLYWGQLPTDYIVSTDKLPTIPAGYLIINEN